MVSPRERELRAGRLLASRGPWMGERERDREQTCYYVLHDARGEDMERSKPENDVV